MLHFVTSYMKHNKSRKQTLESAQYGMEISFTFCKRGCIPENNVKVRTLSFKTFQCPTRPYII